MKMDEYQKKGVTRGAFCKILILKDMFSVVWVVDRHARKRKAAASCRTPNANLPKKYNTRDGLVWQGKSESGRGCHRVNVGQVLWNLSSSCGVRLS
jgi:hypothetical protein